MPVPTRERVRIGDKRFVVGDRVATHTEMLDQVHTGTLVAIFETRHRCQLKIEWDSDSTWLQLVDAYKCWVVQPIEPQQLALFAEVGA
jgi:hypothetical protein